MSQERLLGGGTPGRASVNGSPDSCGIHSLMGVIDTSQLPYLSSGWPKRAFIFTIPYLNGSLVDERVRDLVGVRRQSPMVGILILVGSI